MCVRAPGGSEDALGMRCTSRQEKNNRRRGPLYASGAIVPRLRRLGADEGGNLRVDGTFADAGQIASGRLFAYDVAHVLARGQVARHGLLDAALAGVGHAHADRSASGARLIAGMRRSILSKLARRRDGGRSFVRPAGNKRLVAATREYPTLYSFHLLTSHRGRRSRT